MVDVQRHRGPDDAGVYMSPCGTAGLGHTRLSILDLSEAGSQPMKSAAGNLWIAFNGEIYNYRELRTELADYPFRSATDTEVILAAYSRWGETCLDRLQGMFSFLIWDERERRLFAARDRFGVKPLYYNYSEGTLRLASEIKALHCAGVSAEPDNSSWATYLVRGHHDHSNATFWKGVRSVSPGGVLRWDARDLETDTWYDLATRVPQECNLISSEDAQAQYRDLMMESVRLRFRSDVPVGINLSGGLDSSALLGIVQAVQGQDSEVQAYTFITGDPQYDELPWVTQMLARTRHPSIVCELTPDRVPELARSVQEIEDEPFGGLPTLAYAALFETARREGTIVLLDGQGMDEQWAGYEYYNAPSDRGATLTIQGAASSPVKPACVLPEFRALAEVVEYPQPFPDRLRNLQYRDIRYTKIPRAMRFNDRASMRSSVELREPFLDHRLVEMAFSLPAEFKIRDGTHKWLLRRIVTDLMPAAVAEAPKRPLQTPQREWLRGKLRNWATDLIEEALAFGGGSWLNASGVRAEWKSYCQGESDNSFYVWQWISLGLLAHRASPQTIQHV